MPRAKLIQEAVKELDEKILAIIKESLAESTESYSGLNETVTGNAYQSVMLGETEARGFRKRDSKLFAGVPMLNARFVDLGCNLGEKTRLASLAGAAFAEGVEFEEFFVRIGGLINVLNRITNVS